MTSNVLVALNRLTHCIWKWIKDPFGRKRLQRRHDVVINEMREVKTLVRTTTSKYESRPSFPIGDMVGSQNLRRKKGKNHEH